MSDDAPTRPDSDPDAPDDPRAITRPDPALHTYYVLVSLTGLVFFPFIYLGYRFKYDTLRYRFDDEGVSMSWGRFFERETYLTYRRIQDIQVTSGVLQRRLGLAELHLQTASGGSGAEMKIEGIRNPERLRDFLYERMRGAGEDAPEPARSGAGSASAAPDEPSGEQALAATPDDAALVLLREIRDELRRVNRGAE